MGVTALVTGVIPPYTAVTALLTAVITLLLRVFYLFNYQIENTMYDWIPILQKLGEKLLAISHPILFTAVFRGTQPPVHQQLLH